MLATSGVMVVEALVEELAGPAWTLSPTHVVVGELGEAVDEIDISEWV